MTLETPAGSPLELAAFEARFPAPLGSLAVPDAVMELLQRPDRLDRFVVDDQVRGAVRDLLRAGGFKPTGRNKPSSEYLDGAVQRGELRSINLAVDVDNAVSRHGGLPISVIDADRLSLPARVEVGGPGASFVFNASGQVIDVEGLIGLADAEGPCANAVKDAQRTKTNAETVRTWYLVWGTKAVPGRAAALAAWMKALLEAAQVDVRDL